jgi:Domain of unknown function (DUF1707)/Domain of unknown function (DUF4190)
VFDPANPGLRASDADREATVERLRVAAEEGRIDHEELDERLSAAYGARYCAELEPLTADVTPPPEPREPAGPPVFVQSGRRVNPFAIVSLVCALLLWTMGGLGSVAAVVSGHIALHQIDRSGGAQYGRAAALAGLCLGYVGVAALVLVFATAFLI